MPLVRGSCNCHNAPDSTLIRKESIRPLKFFKYSLGSLPQKKELTTNKLLPEFHCSPRTVIFGVQKVTSTYYILSKERPSNIIGAGKYYNLWLSSCFPVTNLYYGRGMSTRGTPAPFARTDKLISIQGLVLAQSTSSVPQLISPGDAFQQ